MDFVDQSLARRLESAEEMPQVYHARVYQTSHPEIGAVEEEICGGHMIFAGLGSPVGRVVGVGFNGPVANEDLDRMEEFYRQRGAPSQIDVCPLTEPTLLEMLKQRGYTLTEFNNVLFRRLDKNEEFPLPPAEAVIRPGCKEEAPVLNAIVQTSFFPDGDAPQGFEEMLAPLYQMPGAVYFAADLAGKTVACGAGLMIPEHGIIALFGAGTLRDYRRRGLQTALLRRRMQVAAVARCEYAVIVTRGGTTSQHNAERLGFRLAYSKATMVKELGS
jgi:GNAT superfamily N-acetyltransferase